MPYLCIGLCWLRILMGSCCHLSQSVPQLLCNVHSTPAGYWSARLPTVDSILNSAVLWTLWTSHFASNQLRFDGKSLDNAVIESIRCHHGTGNECLSEGWFRWLICHYTSVCWIWPVSEYVIYVERRFERYLYSHLRETWWHPTDRFIIRNFFCMNVSGAGWDGTRGLKVSWLVW
jgi:hypothetical protein